MYNVIRTENKNKTIVVLLCASLAIVMFTGCATGSGSDGGNQPKSEAAPTMTEPVTVKLAASNAQFPEEDFNAYIAEPVKKKYPHITVQRINTSEKGSGLAELVAAGNIPDLVGFYPGNLQTVNEMGLSYNIDELVKTYKFDLARLMPEAVDAVKPPPIRRI